MKKKLKSVLSVFLVILTVVSFASFGAYADEKGISDTINVTFSLMGDAAHGKNGTHYGFYNWIEPESVETAKGTTAMQLLLDVLTEKGYSYENEGYLKSITTPGGCKLGDFVNGSNSGWMYAVNGEMAMVGADDYVLSSGDNLVWYYVDDYMNDIRYSNGYTPEYNINSKITTFHNEYHASGGVITANTPVSYENSKLGFSFRLKNSSEWSKGISDPLIIGENICIAVGDILYVIDKNGEAVKSITLEKSIGYTSRPVYDRGIIVVPFADGGLQAVLADTLQTLWVSEAPEVKNSSGEVKTQQALTSLKADNGYIYYGTAAAGASSTTCGMFCCTELLTGKRVWQYNNTKSGYYWSGAAFYGDTVIFGGDDGILTALDKKTGEVRDTLDTQLGKIRSEVVIDNNKAFFSTTNGNLVSAEISNGGAFGNLSFVNFAKGSTCTPTIIDNKIVVGGSSADYKGVLAIADKNSLEILDTVTALADIKSSPLVSNTVNGTYVYVTSNKTPGSLYAYNIDGSSRELSEIFTPSDEYKNYCMSTPVSDENGNIYYTNDSGQLFSVSSKTSFAKGDVNLDGNVTLADVALIQKYLLGIKNFNTAVSQLADLNGDGRVTLADAVIIQRSFLNA